jgi:radical SAM protein with 4Fe4S-binding SPASM domain
LLLAPENPDATHLLRAVERAEDTGMIAGVRARASDLQGNALKDLAQAGLDYVTLPYASTEAAIHDALLGAGDHALLDATIANLHACEVAVLAEVPLVESTLDTVDETLEHLSSLGVGNISFFAIAATDAMTDDARAGALKAEAMRQTAALVEGIAQEALVRFIWQPPLQRNATLSLAEQVRRGPRCSGDVAVRVEADGSVIPPRGPYRSAGNLLSDDWETIWSDQAFRMYRGRVEAPTHCDICPGLVICAADCPREASGWSQE